MPPEAVRLAAGHFAGKTVFPTPIQLRQMPGISSPFPRKCVIFAQFLRACQNNRLEIPTASPFIFVFLSEASGGGVLPRVGRWAETVAES
jgi:hypothetical protein